MRTRLTIVYILLLLLFTGNVFAQFNWVKIGVNGLTCSQCSQSVELSIRKLPFVSNVEMNLDSTEGKITFKPGLKVEIEKIAQAVFDAGFSVRYLEGAFTFENTTITSGYCHTFEDNQYQFIKVEPKVLNGEVRLKFIGKKFVPPAEFKRWKKDLVPACNKPKGIIFYVTL